MKITSDLPRPLLNWILRRGCQILSLQVARAGAEYQVSVSSDRHRQPVSVDLFNACPHAFQRHAALVVAFRDAGWTTVAYR